MLYSTASRLLFLFIALFIAETAVAQVSRPFRIRYAENTKGNIAFLANQSMTCSGSGCSAALAGNGAANGYRLQNNDFTMQHLDVDGDAATFNSSSADFTLPDGATVRWAGLYWGAATHQGADAAIDANARWEVLLQTPGSSAYSALSATERDNDGYSYVGFREVTAEVALAGSGTYTLANVQTQAGQSNRWAGWSLIIVYEDPNESLRNLSVYDGLAQVTSGSAAITVTPTGFTTPLTAPFESFVGAWGFDGDRSDNGSTGFGSGDRLLVNGTAIQDALSTQNDFFNTTISRLGTNITSRTPANTNNLSIDADFSRAVTSGGANLLANGDTQASVTMTTGGEGIDLFALAFMSDIYEPEIIVTKTFEDQNGGYVEAGDALEYRIHLTNIQYDTASDVVLTDPLPSYLTYVPGTLRITSGPNAGAKTDADGDDQAEYDAASRTLTFRLGNTANTTDGGTVAYLEETVVSFEVTVNADVADGTSIFNQALATYTKTTLGTTNVMASGNARIVTGVGTDLRLTLSDTPDPVFAGQTLTYTFTATNHGPDNAPAARLLNELPEGTVFHSVTTPAGWTATTPAVGSEGRVEFKADNFAVGASAEFTVVVTVAEDFTGTLITNRGIIESALPDLAPADNQASTRTQSIPLKSTYCYVVADWGGSPGDDWLTSVNRLTGIETAIGTGTGTWDIEAAAYWPVTDRLYAADGNIVGTIDTATGLFTALGGGLGTGRGSAGNISLTDIDGLAFDPHTGVLYGTHRRDGSDDILIAINPTTGALIANFFGASLDYIVVPSTAAVGFGDIDDLAIDPFDGTLYAIANNGGSGDRLVRINKTTGAVTNVGPLGQDDMEGLSFDAFGTLYATTGSVPGTNPDTFYTINKSTGTATVVRQLGVGTDYESVACLIDGYNRISGTVFQDVNVNAAYNSGTDTPRSGTTVELYRDADGDGALTGIDTRLATTTSGVDGSYSFTFVAEGSFLVRVVPATLPTTHTLTTGEIRAHNVNGFGDDATGYDFGYAFLTDLELSLTVNNTNPAVGSTVTYTITVNNTSLIAATGVAVGGLVPAGLTTLGYTASQGSIDVNGRWAVGTLSAGASATFTLQARVNAVGVYTSNAEIYSASPTDIDSTPNNNQPAEDDQDSVTISTGTIADLSLTKTVNTSTPAVGQNVTFTLTVTNSGPGNATGVAVTDLLPSGLGFVSATPSQGTYTASTGIWAVGNVPNGAARTLELVATVTGTTAITNVAQITASDQPDPDSTPNNGVPSEDDYATALVEPPAMIDLALDLDVNQPIPNVGDEVIFTYLLTNQAALDATGVVVTDGFPTLDRLTFVSVTTSAGTYSAVTGQWTVGTVRGGETVTLAVQARVNEAVPQVLAAEVTAAHQPDRDSTPNNGLGSEDDWDVTSIAPVGSSGGGEGGIESNGTLAQQLSRVLYQRQNPQPDAGLRPADSPFRFERLAAMGTLSESNEKGISVEHLLPTAGPQQSTPYVVSPTDLLSVTNARRIFAADYLRADQKRVAAVFSAVSAPDELYEHTKVICDRVRGGLLLAVGRTEIHNHPFIVSRFQQPSGAIDHAVSFVLYSTANGFVVDSRYALEEYGVPPGSNQEILNVQVWSVSETYTKELVAEMLDELAALGPVTFRNTEAHAPDVPQVFVRRGAYEQGHLTLELYNAAGASQLKITGGTLSRVEGGPQHNFSTTVEVPKPGEDGALIVEVDIPTGPIFDAGFYVETDKGNGRDVLYLADGAWNYQFDTQKATVSDFDVQPAEDAGLRQPGKWTLERSASLSGTVTESATLYRYLRASGQPMDVSGYQYVEFTAWGEGAVSVMPEQQHPSTGGQFSKLIKLTNEPQRVRIWFEELRNGDGRGGFTGENVVTLSFHAVSDHKRTVPFAIHVEDVRFGGGAGDPLAEVPEELTLKPNYPNPFTTETTIEFGVTETTPVKLIVYDLMGRRIAVLADQVYEPGRYSVRFDAAGLANGLYLYRLETPQQILTRKMTVVR